MIDYEDMILARQERQEIYDDSYSDVDDCEHCSLERLCRLASEGKGEYPKCPLEE